MLIDEIKRTGIIPVVVIERAQDAVKVASSLLAGGIDFMEITFRTEDAWKGIRNVSQNCPEMHVGAGTIVNVAQCKMAIDAGAQFIISPGISEEVIEYAMEREIQVIPGCATPTELMKARAYHITLVKFFPANVLGGPAALKSLHAPFKDMCFIPTGGIDKNSMKEYLQLPYVPAVGGSWVCAKEDIYCGNYIKIEMEAGEAVRIIKELRR